MAATPCPRCGRFMRTGFFLCMVCADALPDVLVVDIGTAVDGGLAPADIPTEFDLHPPDAP